MKNFYKIILNINFVYQKMNKLYIFITKFW